MSLESFTGNVSDLVDTNPTGTDSKSQGDNHIRGIKQTIKQTLGNYTKKFLTSVTGSAYMPSGTTAQRDATPDIGALRYNTDNNAFEGFFNDSQWHNAGGGQMYGTASIKGIFYNNTTISENVTVAAGTNGGSFGPITVSNGFTVTVDNGSVWSIV